MGSSTPLLGYPFPLSTDKIAAGAVNMEDITEAVENSRKLANGKFTADEPGTSYPLGQSHMYWSGGGVAAGWPNSNYCNVVTIMGSAGAGWQWCYRYSGGANSQVYLREWSSGGGGWQVWRQVAGPGVPIAQANGSLKLTPPSGGGDVSTTVTLPSNRFLNQDTYGPITILTGANTTSPTVATSASWTTTGLITNFTIFLQRGTATQTGVYWSAFQGS